MNSPDANSPFLLNEANGAVVDLTKLEDVKARLLARSQLWGRITTDQTVGVGSQMPEIVIYEHIKFAGRNERTNLNWLSVGSWWNDKISSLVVVSGTWRFYEHTHYNNGRLNSGAFWDYPPGQYSDVPNDIISSFECIEW